ncbi:Carbohydrate esterase 4 protein [Entomortierella lignicola]|nr:Carbohydrate esterase 4 protein [Entomortierella lignicola]
MSNAAPLPAQFARQAPFIFNNTYFPHTVTGPAPPSLYRPGQVLHRCTKPKSYAISFDDGPGQLTDELLDYLQEQELQVTFFMNGDNWNCIYNPESRRLLKRAFENKHQIAAHPWSHRDLESLSDKDIREEMNRIEQAFRQILGVVPKYMRPPYGGVGERVRLVLEDMGYVIVLWDVDQLRVVDLEFPSTEKTHMTDDGHSNNRELDTLASTSKWAEAVRGLASTMLDRGAMTLGGIYQEATPEWAIEYVYSLGYDIMPVAKCLGEDDPRLWYKEISQPAPVESLPHSCH